MKLKLNKSSALKTAAVLLSVTLAIIGLIFFRGEYLSWDNIFLLVLLSLLSAVSCGALGAIPPLFSEKASKKKSIVSAIIPTLVFLGLQWGLTFLINVIIGKEQLNVLAADVSSAVLLFYTGILTCICFVSLISKKAVRAALSVLTLLCFTLGSGSYVYSHILAGQYKDFKAISPITGNTDNKRGYEMENADIYVSKNGSDSNDGTKSAPFLTIEKAAETVRGIDKNGKDGITVCIEPGEYRINSLIFTKEDSGTESCPVTYVASTEGEVIINGGVTLSPSDFAPAGSYPEIEERLCAEAKENVYILDLTKAPYSLTKEDWGKLYAIGSYNTASSYDGDFTGPLYCELFVNDKRQSLARYPDEGFLYTEEVVSTGLGRESDGALTAVENWDDIRNPEPDVYRINSRLAQRVGGWKTLEDVWMFGYWKYDWADASTLIGNFEKDTGIISPKFVSAYGTKTQAPYYFYNVLEELTAQGEWYLDREKGLLCLYAPDNFSDAEIDLSLSLKPLINAEADYLTFRGFTFKGTRGNAIEITGNHNTVEHCLIKNIADNAVVIKGFNNLVYNNEITHTGKGGIIIDGGDRETLTPGNSRADNNYIHDWSEIYLTYQPAVTLNGVGNICSHNEMVNSPHEAVTWSGNNHIIEYNLIHDVCLLSDDAGAVYSGRRWDWYGTVIRYNAIYNLGSDGHKPDGIYLDDALSGIEVYGNILINIPKLGIHLGGGRDLEVWGNIIINAGEHPISYDSRAREGALDGGWFTHSSDKNSGMWKLLYDSPWQSDTWLQAYPQYKGYSDDFSQSETAAFIPNPGNSNVSGNIIIDKYASIGNISEAADTFSNISGNALYYIYRLDIIFNAPDKGDYTLKKDCPVYKEIPDFKDIPFDEIGRK